MKSDMEVEIEFGYGKVPSFPCNLPCPPIVDYRKGRKLESCSGNKIS